MKHFKSIAVALILIASVKAYSQNEYDCVMRKDILLTKAGHESKANISLLEMGSLDKVEILFGKGLSAKKEVDEMSNDSIIVAKYDNELTLWFSDKWKHLLYFQISSDKYSLKLPGNVIIKVGMKAEELKAIFPKSYSKRETIIYDGKDKGKIHFKVAFCFTLDNKTVYEDAWISFFISKEDGILERIKAYELP